MLVSFLRMEDNPEKLGQMIAKFMPLVKLGFTMLATVLSPLIIFVAVLGGIAQIFRAAFADTPHEDDAIAMRQQALLAFIFPAAICVVLVVGIFSPQRAVSLLVKCVPLTCSDFARIYVFAERFLKMGMERIREFENMIFCEGENDNVSRDRDFIVACRNVLLPFFISWGSELQNGPALDILKQFVPGMGGCDWAPWIKDICVETGFERDVLVKAVDENDGKVLFQAGKAVYGIVLSRLLEMEREHPDCKGFTAAFNDTVTSLIGMERVGGRIATFIRRKMAKPVLDRIIGVLCGDDIKFSNDKTRDAAVKSEIAAAAADPFFISFVAGELFKRNSTITGLNLVCHIHEFVRRSGAIYIESVTFALKKKIVAELGAVDAHPMDYERIIERHIAETIGVSRFIIRSPDYNSAGKLNKLCAILDGSLHCRARGAKMSSNDYVSDVVDSLKKYTTMEEEVDEEEAGSDENANGEVANGEEMFKAFIEPLEEFAENVRELAVDEEVDRVFKDAMAAVAGSRLADLIDKDDGYCVISAICKFLSPSL